MRADRLSSAILPVALWTFAFPMLVGQDHAHPAPEKLGRVSFPTSCSPAAQGEFERAVERRKWVDAAALEPRPGVVPQVAAVTLWARVIGMARGARLDAATTEIDRLDSMYEKLRAAGNSYWATQMELFWTALPVRRTDSPVWDNANCANPLVGSVNTSSKIGEGCPVTSSRSRFMGAGKRTPWWT